MRTTVLIQSLLLVAMLLSCPMLDARASATVSAYVAPWEVAVHVSLVGVNASFYDLARMHAEAFNETTVPEAIKAFLAEKGLEDIYYRDASLSFNDTSRSIRLSFVLAGGDLMDFRYNKTDMSRIYELRADWRRADVTVKSGEESFKLNFSSYFGAPLQEWEEGEYEVAPGDVRCSLFLNSTVEDKLFGNATAWAFWRFVFPRGAEVLKARGDFVTFRLPPEPLDLFMASPFWPLLAIFVVVGVAIAYRRAAVKLVKPAGEEG
ncbi:MAG TPA: hypothetical protein ENG43_00445 [Candidatus Bathyarchaeota archaeon]|nr:hypothetical protein [Candidatus Bathyarchaeota archaeon]HEW89795.1 hypothetical protein [Candidatus Bathyarchaeota archaeon]